jgi:hypothetical protein
VPNALSFVHELSGFHEVGIEMAVIPGRHRRSVSITAFILNAVKRFNFSAGERTLRRKGHRSPCRIQTFVLFSPTVGRVGKDLAPMRTESTLL